SDGALERDPDGVFELRRDAERAHEVAARSPGDDCELRSPGPDEPVRHLVDSAVAADRDQPLRTALERRARQLTQVLGPFGEERVAGQPERGGASCELRPTAA